MIQITNSMEEARRIEEVERNGKRRLTWLIQWRLRGLSFVSEPPPNWLVHGNHIRAGVITGRLPISSGHIQEIING